MWQPADHLNTGWRIFAGQQIEVPPNHLINKGDATPRTSLQTTTAQWLIKLSYSASPYDRRHVKFTTPRDEQTHTQNFSPPPCIPVNRTDQQHLCSSPQLFFTDRIRTSLRDTVKLLSVSPSPLPPTTLSALSPHHRVTAPSHDPVRTRHRIKHSFNITMRQWEPAVRCVRALKSDLQTTNQLKGNRRNLPTKITIYINQRKQNKKYCESITNSTWSIKPYSPGVTVYHIRVCVCACV